MQDHMFCKNLYSNALIKGRRREISCGFRLLRCQEDGWVILGPVSILKLAYFTFLL